MCVVAGIAGASLVGGAVSAIGAKGAADAQGRAARQSAQTQADMYNQTRADLSPYNKVGQAANYRLGSVLGLPGFSPMSGGALTNYLQNQPGYQFQFGQGQQALERSAAARGLLTSGATGKALTRYGQGFASNYLQNYIGNLQGLAGLGENAAAQTGNAATETGRGIASSQVYGGNAAAAGQVGMANAFTGAINQGAGLYGLYQGGYFGNRQTPASSIWNNNSDTPWYMNPWYAGGSTYKPPG